MFSGIIEGFEKPKKINKYPSGMRVEIPVPKGWKVKEGDSISVDGVCSTVEKLEEGAFTVYYMPETLNKSNLSQISVEHYFNLEMPLRLNSLVGGHLVSGHVDTTAVVKSFKNEKDSRILEFSLKKEFTKYIVYKGSITVNGVSLTVVSVSNNSFTVSLIPYTLSHTNLGSLKTGDKVNIEVDLVAKYLEKLIVK